MSRGRWMLAAAAVAAGLGSAVAWQREPQPASAAAAPLDGLQLFQAKGCASCHAGPIPRR